MRPTAAVIYGPPGIGKSSMGAAIPGVVFLIDSAEDGIHTLKSNNLIKADIPILPNATSWRDVLDMLNVLATEEHDYKALVIDTLGGLERLCHEHVCQRDYQGNWGDRGFMSYQKGYDVSLADWRLFLNALDTVRDRGMGVVCLAHSSVRTHKNPDGEDFDRWIPDLHKTTWTLTHKWADMVLFANYYVTTAKEGGKAKGKGGQRRLVYTEYHAAYEAKNRHSLPDTIEMGGSGEEAWANLRTAMVEARKAGE